MLETAHEVSFTRFHMQALTPFSSGSGSNLLCGSLGLLAVERALCKGFQHGLMACLSSVSQSYACKHPTIQAHFRSIITLWKHQSPPNLMPEIPSSGLQSCFGASFNSTLTNFKPKSLNLTLQNLNPVAPRPESLDPSPCGS